ncbi:STAS domain-containing protein, partial [Micromonospora sp. NPDC047753]|uniref:STAS domain-containing protein n=1 Tax=Micromonospora sp. NPDC047753 TaxID=3154817 RepID=UPI0033FA51E1
STVAIGAVVGVAAARLRGPYLAGVTLAVAVVADLTFCDSTGMAVFVRGDNQAAADGGWLRLTGANGRVERVLRVTGLADVLRYEPESVDPASRSAS